MAAKGGVVDHAKQLLPKRGSTSGGEYGQTERSIVLQFKTALAELE